MTQTAPDSLYLNHYELSEESGIATSKDWKDFLNEPDIRAFITGELTMLHKSTMHKIAKDADSSRSVGQAQLMKSMQDLIENGVTQGGGGATFIYTYVPGTEAQKKADNYEELRSDIFETTRLPRR